MWPFSSRADTATHAAGNSAENRAGRSSQAEQDPALTQKKRARRRLIGAISVALLAIIVLPLVFDQEPKPIGDEITIKIPDQDTPFAPRKIVPALTDIPAASESPAAAVIEPPKESVGAANATETVKEPIKESAKEPAKEIAREKNKEAAKEPVKITAQAEKERDAKRAQAALEGKDAIAKRSETVSDGKFVVQLGAFSTPEKIKPLQDKLNAAGIKSYTQKIQTGQGERIRLRVGPYSDRAEAERMLKKIKAAGLPGTVLFLK